MGVLTGLFAVAKAIPAARDIVVQLNAMLLKWELSRITNQYTEKQRLISVLISSISKAETKEERRALSKILARYTSGKY
jgi:hypothetical protein